MWQNEVLQPRNEIINWLLRQLRHVDLTLICFWREIYCLHTPFIRTDDYWAAPLQQMPSSLTTFRVAAVEAADSAAMLGKLPDLLELLEVVKEWAPISWSAAAIKLARIFQVQPLPPTAPRLAFLLLSRPPHVDVSSRFNYEYHSLCIHQNLLVKLYVSW